ncbi:hypothetical protein [Peterkaempfera sp. SMS 1(5)a]|uniref:hypothetical protein n=1 Tax=Peterkaempfera podocarpi TaxID=3232308 RepID=UPI00366B1C73
MTGAVDGRSELTRPQGLNFNLRTGIGMLAVAAVFLAWMRLRPLTPKQEPGPEAVSEAVSERG